MAKLREISSIEHGLTEAIKNLKSKVIEEVTGKSESFLRKCSDPDLDQQLDHRDAVKIDKACVQKGLTPYLLRSHEYIIQKELKNVVTDQKDLNELMIEVQNFNSTAPLSMIFFPDLDRLYDQALQSVDPAYRISKKNKEKFNEKYEMRAVLGLN